MFLRFHLSNCGHVCQIFKMSVKLIIPSVGDCCDRSNSAIVTVTIENVKSKYMSTALLLDMI